MRILDILYQHKLKEYEERLRQLTDPSIVYVTDLTSCSYKRFYRIHYPHLSFKFEPSLVLGDLVHMGLSTLVTSTGEWRSEVEVRRSFDIDGKRYTLLGRADLVQYSGDKPVHVVEVKTMKESSLSLPLEHHELQLQVYMNLLGVSEGTLLYVAPDTLVEIPVHFRELDLGSMMEETVYMRRAPRYGWECRYCIYRKICPIPRRRQEPRHEAS
ncbi:MAG: CRISPR-associated protein Cas4 [Crenarchaeota archaeon]|nr:CRISPR-associated protein Cas4 [Thermoproteota archaeon]